MPITNKLDLVLSIYISFIGKRVSIIRLAKCKTYVPIQIVKCERNQKFLVYPNFTNGWKSFNCAFVNSFELFFSLLISKCSSHMICSHLRKIDDK